MILTVTLNAAIDRTVAVPNFRLGHRHRAVEARTVAGGKGINVARALKLLGRPGDRHRLRRRPDRRPPAGAPRRGVGPHRLHPDRRRDADQPRRDRPDLRRADRDQRARPRGQRRGGRALPRAARLPGARRADLRARRQPAAAVAATTSTRADRRRAARRSASRRSLDAEGEPMLAGLRAGPRSSPRTSARPRSAVGQEFNDREDALAGLARAWSSSGAAEAVITRPEGCVAVVGDGRTSAVPRGDRPEPLEPVSTVGSGDAFLAGYVAARYDGAPAARSASLTASPAAPSRPSTSAPARVDRGRGRAPAARVESRELETPAKV